MCECVREREGVQEADEDRESRSVSVSSREREREKESKRICESQWHTETGRGCLCVSTWCKWLGERL